MTQILDCPNCGSNQTSLFYKLRQVPVHSVVLMRSRQEALAVQQGDISLGFCDDCGFIGNFDFQEDLLDYAAEYESTQAYSSQFNVFHQQLAEQLIDRYDLHNKKIVEIGCGNGEFLELICRLGNNRGLGFDPAHQRDILDDKDSGRVEFIRDYYSEKYSHIHADFVISKMTLEHIFETQRFVKQLRCALGSNSEGIVFVQVPDATRILEEAAFWDIHYEHCCYFTPGVLVGGLSRIRFRCPRRAQCLLRHLPGHRSQKEQHSTGASVGRHSENGRQDACRTVQARHRRND